MKKRTKILLTILCIPILGIISIFGWMLTSEGYNPIDPSIDTRYSTEYDEEKFNSIQIGIDSTKVTQLIGKPMYIQEMSENRKLWYFTSDGKCNWKDFAWLGREIEFDKNGKVLKIKKLIHYD